MIDLREPEDFFINSPEGFTIFIVENMFAQRRGANYFRSFKGSKNYFSSESEIRYLTNALLRQIQKNVVNLSDLTSQIFLPKIKKSIVDLITPIAKIAFANEIQVSNPNEIDPIIIEENAITKRTISQLVSLYYHSTLHPAIIIILNDNNFIRVEELLKICPHGLNVNMIRNTGDVITYKIINTGEQDCHGFIDAFSRHCFSTCSHTKKEILLNAEWDRKDILFSYLPLILKMRSELIFDAKDSVKQLCLETVHNLEIFTCESQSDEVILEALLCLSKLSKVYAFDNAGTDLKDAVSIAMDLDDKVLLAHTMRYIDFDKGIERFQKIALLEEATKVFQNNKIEDHAFYCRNNALLQTFYSEQIDRQAFNNLADEAFYSVPGLVGMSIIFNNAGVANLYNGRYLDAIDYFSKGLPYGKSRLLQFYGLQCNKLIARALSLEVIEISSLYVLIGEIISSFPKNAYSFLTANYIVNILSIVLHQEPQKFHSFITGIPELIPIINSGLQAQFGQNTLSTQIIVLSSKYKEFCIKGLKRVPTSTASYGIRTDFIIKYGYNPVIFNAWL